MFFKSWYRKGQLKHGTGGRTMRLISEDDVLALLINHHFDDDKKKGVLKYFDVYLVHHRL